MHTLRFFGGRGWISRAALLKTAHWAVFAPSSAPSPQLFESTRPISLALSQNKNLSVLAYVEVFWWSEATQIRTIALWGIFGFTVCPHWPLGNTPIFTFYVLRRTTCLFYHEGRLLSTVFYVFLQMHFPCRETAEQRREKPCSHAGTAKSEKKASRKKLIGKLQEKLGTICEKCKTFLSLH